MDLKTVIDWPLWIGLEQQLADKIHAYVYTIDLHGRVIAESGKPCAFLHLAAATEAYKDWQRGLFRLKQKDVFVERDPAGFFNVLWPLFFYDKLFGYCVVSSLVVDRQELRPVEDIEPHEWLSDISIVDEQIIKNITLIVGLLQTIVFPVLIDHKNSRENAAELGIVLDFMSEIGSVLDQDRLIELSMGFFVQRLQLANCTIQFRTKTYRHYTNTALLPSYERVEGRAARECQSAHRVVTFNGIGHEALFEHINAIEKLPSSVLAAALPDGFVFFYSGHDLQSGLPLATQLIEKFSHALINAAQYRTTQEFGLTDSLTQIHNRAYFIAALQHHTALAQQQKTALQIGILDIDDFKKYNDAHGHIEGDVLLKSIAATIRRELGAQDIFARYGGEEFVFLCPGQTEEQVIAKAWQLCTVVEQTTQVTISIGLVSSFAYLSAEQLLQHADKALYEAKTAGKNRVIHHVIEPEAPSDRLSEDELPNEEEIEELRKKGVRFG